MTDNWTVILTPRFEAAVHRHLPTSVSYEQLLGELWQRASKMPLGLDPFRWFLRVAVNLAKDHARSERRRSKHEKNITDLTGSTHDSEGERGQPIQFERVTHVEPSERLEAWEQRRQIKDAARRAKLTRPERCAVWARMRGKLAQWANVNKLRTNTASVLAHRARQKMRPFLSEC